MFIYHGTREICFKDNDFPKLFKVSHININDKENI